VSGSGERRKRLARGNSLADDAPDRSVLRMHRAKFFSSWWRGLALCAIALSLSGCVAPSSPTGTAGPGPGNRAGVKYRQALAGSTHGCALVNGGFALCWGSGGDLGDGTLVDSETPVRVQGPQIFGQLDVGSFSCGITTGLSGGQAWCWGENTSGRLGDGTSEDRLTPAPLDSPLFFTDITTGGVHSCAISTQEDLYCWGSNGFQQLLAHADTFSVSPLPLAAGTKFKRVDAGGLQTCAIDLTDRVHCWGGDWGGTLQEVAAAPVFERFSVGSRHACGLTADGEAFCFGENTQGQLGDGTFDEDPLGSPPVPVATSIRFTDISAGSLHTCAVTADGEVYCWGADSLGQLGDGNAPGEPSKKNVPSRTVPVSSFVKFTTISAGRFLSCAVTDRETAFCWGFGTGSAAQPFSQSPVEVGS